MVLFLCVGGRDVRDTYEKIFILEILTANCLNVVYRFYAQSSDMV